MKFLLLALLLLSFSHVYAQTVHDGLHTQVKRKDLEASEKKVILEVLHKNDELFNSFLSQDQKKIETAATELHALVSKSGSKVLSSLKKSHMLLNIKSTNKNESNLVAYESFLNPLIEIVKSYNVGEKFNIFNCPMVKKSWIQDVAKDKDVKNVYAMEMLECGSQETNF